ncbi:unnamed protein product [Mycena citricolor]|uniref:Uncharacterized protein n=1 Tax=Mycena citricolor TaxID=2018698 RepID=A0AAD2K523_9AGAR|nr:unnamed protein product [Mycena citricolor]
MADTLEPIVIPPMVVEKHFTCSGSGLRFEEQERVSADSLRSLLLPSAGRNGIGDRDRPKAWWGAQSLFYGMKYTKTMTIAQLRAQLEDALRDKKTALRVPQSLLDLEYQSNKEFRELNAQVRDKAGMGAGAGTGAGGKRKRATTDESGATEKTTKSAASQKKPRLQKAEAAPVPKTKPRTKQTAKKSTMDVVPAPSSSKPAPKQTAANSTSAYDIEGFEPMDVDVEPMVQQTKQTARKSTGGRPPALHPSRSRNTKRQPRADSVSGHWFIRCPFITESWGHDDLSVNIVQTGASLLGEFDFGVIRGLIRSERVEPRGANGAYVALLWAGKTGEGYDGGISPPNPTRSGYIKFTGDHLKGQMNSVPACGNSLEFDGQWVGPGVGITSNWGDYSQDAYERANRSRWGNRW